MEESDENDEKMSQKSDQQKSDENQKNEKIDKVVEINCGGTHQIMVKKSVLTKVPGSDLANLFSGKHKLKLDENGKVFLDRDGASFQNVVSFLRNNLKVGNFDSQFQKE